MARQMLLRCSTLSARAVSRESSIAGSRICSSNNEYVAWSRSLSGLSLYAPRAGERGSGIEKITAQFGRFHGCLGRYGTGLELGTGSRQASTEQKTRGAELNRKILESRHSVSSDLTSTLSNTNGSTSHNPAPSPTRSARIKLRDRLPPLPLPRENIYTLPNLLTFSRLLSAPTIGALILYNQHTAAIALFAYAGLTDLLDGWIARRWNLTTVVGTVVDPIADKSLMTISTVCLALKGLLPVWLATLILGRDISLAVAAVYYRYASLLPPKTLQRYWDFSLPSAEVYPTIISKVNTALQLGLIGAATALPVVVSPSGPSALSGLLGDVNVQQVVQGMQWLVAGTTIWSGASYLYTRDAVRILGEGMDQREKRTVLTKGRVVIGSCFAVCGGVAWALER